MPSRQSLAGLFFQIPYPLRAKQMRKACPIALVSSSKSLIESVTFSVIVYLNLSSCSSIQTAGRSMKRFACDVSIVTRTLTNLDIQTARIDEVQNRFLPAHANKYHTPRQFRMVIVCKQVVDLSQGVALIALYRE